jgi:hypothetical protein
VAILLVVIGGHSIGGYSISGYWWLLVAIHDYWCLFYWWLLMIILLVFIRGYFINGY